MEAETRKVMQRPQPQLQETSRQAVKESFRAASRQSVAIARAIYLSKRQGPDTWTTRPPPSGPAENNQKAAADLIMQLKKEGIGIFLISHRTCTTCSILSDRVYRP